MLVLTIIFDIKYQQFLIKSSLINYFLLNKTHPKSENTYNKGRKGGRKEEKKGRREGGKRKYLSRYIILE